MMLWIALSIMTLLALLFATLPLLKNKKQSQMLNKMANVQIYEERLKELLQDRELGLITPENFQAQQLELQKTLIQDQSEFNQSHESVALNSNKSIFLLVVLIPLFAFFAYVKWWGSSQLWQQQQQINANQINVANYLNQYHSTTDILNKLQTVVAQHPTDPKGWYLLGRLQMGMNLNQEACVSLKKSYELQSDDFDTMMAYAQSCFESNNHQLTPELKKVLQQAITQAPDNPEPINLLALNAFYAKRYQEAIDYWTSIIQRYPVDTNDATLLQQTIDKTRKLMREKTSGKK